MFNVGFGELLVLAVIGLLVFGPDKLPGAVSRGTAVIRQLRTMASQATTDIKDAAGWDDDDTRAAARTVADLNPKRWVSGVLEPITDGAGGSGPGTAARPPGAAASPPAGDKQSRDDVDPDLL